MINCGGDHGFHISREYADITKPSTNGSIILQNCTSVLIKNITIKVKAGNVGIFAVNVKKYSQFLHTSITMDCSNCPINNSHPKQKNGIVLYSYDSKEMINSNFLISNFLYKATGSCSYPLHYAVSILLFQKHFNVNIVIQSTAFSNFTNIGAIYYYGETCGLNVHSSLTIENCLVSHNNASLSNFKMFYILLYNFGCFDRALMQEYCSQQVNNISFIYSKFSNNFNISSVIYAIPASSRTITGHFIINSSMYYNNSNTHFFNTESDTEIGWQFTNYVIFFNTTIASNNHDNGRNLISAKSGWMKMMGPVVIANNSLYENIAKLHSTGVVFEYDVDISYNVARQLFDSSYFIIKENTTITASGNTVYTIAKQTAALSVNSHSVHVCPIQFYSDRVGNLDISQTELELIFKVKIHNNTHMWSNYLLGECKFFLNCVWLAGTAFHERTSRHVFKAVLNMSNNTLINETTTRRIPMSICPCKDNQTFCRKPNLGNIFPGQILNVGLHVSNLDTQKNRPLTFVVVLNTSESKCDIVHTSQLSQTCLTSGCNVYSYTLWPNPITIKTCKLFIGLSNLPNDVPEIFYVTLDPCPKGFTPQVNKKMCDCDPVLENSVLSIESCNLDNGTILRPANSWISTDVTSNGTQSYHISKQCPFDYCLPHSLYINLSVPDMQCQFNRSGVLCGKCQQGLSAVFGSSQCQHCSNESLFIIAPLAISGIVLVLALFIFNLTITNGTITPLSSMST